jgi:hypothetical protein
MFADPALALLNVTVAPLRLWIEALPALAPFVKFAAANVPLVTIWTLPLMLAVDPLTFNVAFAPDTETLCCELELFAIPPRVKAVEPAPVVLNVSDVAPVPGV